MFFFFFRSMKHTSAAAVDVTLLFIFFSKTSIRALSYTIAFIYYCI